jgi:hypothetical protein
MKTATASAAAAAAASPAKPKPQVDAAAAAPSIKPNHPGHPLFADYKKLVVAGIQHHASEEKGANKAEITEWVQKHHATLVHLDDEQFKDLKVQTMLHQLVEEEDQSIIRHNTSPITYTKASEAKAAEAAAHFDDFKKLVLAAIQHHANDGAGATKAEITEWCAAHHNTLVKLTDEQFKLLHVQAMLNQLDKGEGACVVKHEDAHPLRYSKVEGGKKTPGSPRKAAK